LAVAEAVSLLRDLGASAEAGGPFASERGVAWVSVPAAAVDDAVVRLPRLGYSVAVELVVDRDRVERVHEEDASAMRDEAVDRRTFAIRSPDGEVREVRGYRGDGGALSKRGLAVPDARLLANLARPAGGGLVLDPFAGAGGIVLALGSDTAVVSADVDGVVAPGLHALTAGRHMQASAAALPFADGSLAGVATEPPFDPSTDDVVVKALGECLRVVRPGGRIAVMAPERQIRLLRRVHGAAVIDEPVDRKGLAVRVAVWDA
jgi:SAM-dependent methyltransferase